MKLEKLSLGMVILIQLTLLAEPLYFVSISPPNPVTAEELAAEEKLSQELQSGKRSLSAYDQMTIFRENQTIRKQAINYESSMRSIFFQDIQLSTICLLLEGWLIWRYRKYLRNGESKTQDQLKKPG